MHIEGDVIRLSATDIANHLACRHLTQLDRAVAEGRLDAPAWRDPNLAILQERGLAHEKAYLDHLRARGVDVVELRDGGVPADQDRTSARERTLAAMRAGAGAVVQAELGEGRWAGRADVLLRVETPSDLGGWSYEVVDTKLAQETRAGTVLQLCLYTDLVASAQGLAPSRMHVVKPGADFEPESFRCEEFAAYYRLVRRRLEETVAAPPSQSTYPDPVEHCGICRWWKECDTRRHVDDNLCLVAGIRPLHVDELEHQGITTLEGYAKEQAPVRRRPERGNIEAFSRAHGQARVQLRGRIEKKQVHDLLDPRPGLGFSQLPSPDAGDLFFDIESDPFAGDDGMEYLLGVSFSDGELWPRYRAFWALDRMEEREALEGFVDFVMGRWEKHPSMHVYHFSPYEPAALKRLIGRHGTREAELDRLLRAEKFIDLLAVTRHAVRVSVESYSLKALEESFGFVRAVDLRAASAALRRLAAALERAGRGDVSAEDRAAVEAYNRDDCLSTAALRDWLEKRRADLEARQGAVERPAEKSGDASEGVEEKAADVKAVAVRLISGLPEDRQSWGPAEKARWLLAHQLEYFRREDKCAWWEFYRIQDLDHEDLLEERKAISGLRYIGDAEDGRGTARKAPGSTAAVHRYSFPDQEIAIDEGHDLFEIGDGQKRIGKLRSIDLAGHVLEIEKSLKSKEIHPEAVMVNERVSPVPVDRALLELGRSVADFGVDGNGPFRAARDLLLKARPRLRTPTQGSLRVRGEDVVNAAVRLAGDLADSVLAIQGPPGTGKTWTGARMIAALAFEKKRIGVVAVSHKVIDNLLKEALSAARDAGMSLRVIHKDKVSKTGDDPVGIEKVDDNATARAGLAAGKVVGGTTWFWSRDDMVESVDYLFIDEAGQMSLAHALAAARSARNIVLLGDPQQLEQPQRGAHPEGAEVAALVHILDGHRTMPDEAGLFLEETWRLHPRICAFTSELFYDRRLVSREGLQGQALGGRTPFDGSGLFFVPVDHEGNQNSSREEADAVARIVGALLSPGVRWTDSRGEAKALVPSNIMVVAPYNAQVAALKVRMPRGVAVGTVDRFQGQQAPVVIYSMTSSSAEDAPRGMGFLYNPHRLNVATSRALCACILVAARRLLEPECGTPEQMRWANCMCRYRELATEVTV
jgi:predicted RecB family nuclease